jgi:flagellar motor protein MotB
VIKPSLADQEEPYFRVARYSTATSENTPGISAASVERLKCPFRIESHTDNSGTKMLNMTLSARRAAGVVAWLSGRGIKRLRMEPAGLGDTHPVADNSIEEGRAKNERIELVKLSAQH